jgi:LDH2 family malate/lactate/ureidoglycolate dehydrogenase
MPSDRFAALIAGHVQAIRDSAKAEGQNRIYLPGEIEAERERLNRARGVEIDPPVVKAIDGLLEKAGLPVRLNDGEVQA